MSIDGAEQDTQVTQDTWEAGDDLREALIAFVPLSQGDVARILDHMRETNLSFSGAAVQLDLVTADELAEIAARERTPVAGRRKGLIETAIRRVSDRRDLVVTRGEGRVSNQLNHLLNADDPRSEKIRALRTELMLLADSNQKGNVLAVIGPDRRDGRSQLSAELAISFAQLGRRTLLLDADLRHPSQHVLFSTDSQFGLAQTLAQGDSLYLNGIENIPALSLLTCGQPVPNPLELVSNRRFANMVTELRRQYEFIIIDTPAVSPYADALQIADVTQHALIVSRAKTTSFAGMKDMLRRLAVTNTKILGAVFNKF